MWTLHLQLVDRKNKREEAGGSGGGKTRPPYPPTAPWRWPGGVAGEDQEPRRGWQGDIGSHPRAALSLGGYLGGSFAPAVSRLTLRTLEPGRLRVPPGAGAGKGRQNSRRGQREVPGAPKTALSTETHTSSCPPPFNKIAERLGSCLSWEQRSCPDAFAGADGHSSWAGGVGPSSIAAFSCPPGPRVRGGQIQLLFPVLSPAPMPVKQSAVSLGAHRCLSARSLTGLAGGLGPPNHRSSSIRCFRGGQLS